MSRVARADVSVCIFAYNEESTIERTVSSILAQDCQDRIAAVLVGANGCTDSTVRLIRDMARREPLVRIIEVSERGKANMWNIFRANVASPFAVFVDGDEEVAPTAVRYLVEALESDSRLVFAVGESREVHGWRTLGSWLVSVPDPDRVGISGRLYAADLRNLNAVMMRDGFVEMPPTVIHEDMFLSCLIDHAEWRHVPDAECVHRAPLLRERFGREVRSHAARVQLEEEFPQFHRRLKEQDGLRARSRRRLATLKAIDGWLRRVVVVLTYPLRRAFLAIVYARVRRRGREYYESGEYRSGWIRVESEKATLGGDAARRRT